MTKPSEALQIASQAVELAIQVAAGKRFYSQLERMLKVLDDLWKIKYWCETEELQREKLDKEKESCKNAEPSSSSSSG